MKAKQRTQISALVEESGPGNQLWMAKKTKEEESH
jgi:hypothetical protein